MDTARATDAQLAARMEKLNRDLEGIETEKQEVHDELDKRLVAANIQADVDAFIASVDPSRRDAVVHGIAANGASQAHGTGQDG